MRAGFHKKNISSLEIIDTTTNKVNRAVSTSINLSLCFLKMPKNRNCKIPKQIAAAMAILSGKKASMTIYTISGKRLCNKVERIFIIKKSGKWDSNLRPSAWETDALPTELLPHSFCKINNFFGKK